MARRSVKLLLLLGLLVAGGGLLQTPLLAAARQALWSAAVGAAGRWDWVGPLEYNAEATDQLSQLRAENIRLKSELQDYNTLRKQLRQPALESSRPIPALVAGAPLDVFRTHLLVNQGTASGVVLGAPVVVNGSTLVGFISELQERTAVLRLLWDPATSIPAEVVDVEAARGLLAGHLYTSLMLNTIPRDADLHPGQNVVSVAQDLTPPGLVVGSVERVYKEENKAYQQARLAVPYNPARLRAVTIIVPP